ncbi:MAG: hypothetical protein KDD70_07870 [Bdellovibrionales bacterium]|nr:hypothetical protein [Bdellovibrionales bacterium]
MDEQTLQSVRLGIESLHLGKYAESVGYLDQANKKNGASRQLQILKEAT